MASAEVVCKKRSAECQREYLQSGVQLDGKIRGRVRETNNAIYVSNLKIYQKNSDKPALQVVTKENDKKRVIIKNVKVNSKNASIIRKSGIAATVGIHLENKNNIVDNIKINSRGYNTYVSKSGKSQNAAGVFVGQYKNDATENLKQTNVTIDSSGTNFIKAVQNMP